MSILFHEELYRSPSVMSLVKNFPLTVCGAGALGANITESLARSGFCQLTVVDRDRLLANSAAIIDTFDKSIDCYLCCYPKATKFNLHDRIFCSKATYIVKCLVAVARNAIA